MLCKIPRWRDFDDDESFASDSGESLEAVSLAPKTRIEVCGNS